MYYQDIQLKQDSFNQDQLRKAFVSKVYSIIAIQLAFTFFFTLLATSLPSIILFQYSHPVLYILILIIAIVVEIVIFCTSQARKFPNNFILLGIFTFCQSYLVSVCVSFYAYNWNIQKNELVPDSDGIKLVLLALFLTAALVSLLTIYAWQTKVDYTQCYSLILISMFGLMVLMILSFMFNISQAVISAITIVIFGFYLVYDTQMVLGKGTYKLQYDDFIIGAMIIYIDIVVMFLQILRLLGALRND